MSRASPARIATPSYRRPQARGTGKSCARCLICGSSDLFVRKDFPHRLGLAIVVSGFTLSCMTWYFYWTYLTFAVLFATALADMVLFFIVGESLTCYRCRAEYRQLPSMTEHGPFSLETHERYRQQAARLASSIPVGGGTPREVAAAMIERRNKPRLRLVPKVFRPSYRLS